MTLLRWFGFGSKAVAQSRPGTDIATCERCHALLEHRFIWTLVDHLCKDHKQTSTAASATVEWMDERLQSGKGRINGQK